MKYRTGLEPRLVTLPDERMLVIKIQGDPQQVWGQALSTLYQAFMRLQSAGPGLKITSPRVRWSSSPPLAPTQWEGHMGLVLPPAIQQLPPAVASALPKLFIETWTYGQVAELLHIGTLAQEAQTRDKLLLFIQQQGYQAQTEKYEVEYLKRLNLLASGWQKKYYAILRYQIKKMK